MEVLPSLVLVCETENHAMDEGKKKAPGEPNASRWQGTESNRRHGDFQSPALPTELPGLNNGKGRNRTADTGIFSPLLYLLSYLAMYSLR